MAYPTSQGQVPVARKYRNFRILPCGAGGWKAYDMHIHMTVLTAPSIELLVKSAITLAEDEGKPVFLLYAPRVRRPPRLPLVNPSLRRAREMVGTQYMSTARREILEQRLRLGART